MCGQGGGDMRLSTAAEPSKAGPKTSVGAQFHMAFWNLFHECFDIISLKFGIFIQYILCTKPQRINDNIVDISIAES